MTDHRRGGWYAIATAPQCEAKAAKEVRKAGYRCYVPKRRKTIKHHRDKKRIIKHFLLIRGYIFIRMTRITALGEPDFYHLKNCDGVLQVLGTRVRQDDGREIGPWPIPRNEIARLMRAQRERKFDDLDTFDTGRALMAKARGSFPQGTAVTIAKGEFAGVFGTVDDIVNQGVVRVLVEMLGRLTPVDCEPASLERIEA